jgi:ribosomal protein S18 acetylase RimI-like enzyme
VALSGNKVEGIIISCHTPVVINYREMIDSFVESGVLVGERFTRVYKEYYELLKDEPNGIYIANVCVAEQSRGKGIGKKMLSVFLKNYEIYHLETVKANKAALSLYKSVGFKIDCEYAGFTDVPCYRMTRTLKEDNNGG